MSPDLQFEGELYNGLVAMLAVVGILTVEALGRGPWWQAYNTVSPGGIVCVCAAAVQCVKSCDLNCLFVLPP